MGLEKEMYSFYLSLSCLILLFSMCYCLQMESGKSSVRRKHSARYVVYRDYLGGCKRLLFDSPFQGVGSNLLNFKEESLEVPSFQIMDEQQKLDLFEQVC